MSLKLASNCKGRHRTMAVAPVDSSSFPVLGFLSWGPELQLHCQKSFFPHSQPKGLDMSCFQKWKCRNLVSSGGNWESHSWQKEVKPLKCKSDRALIFLSTLHCKYFYACLPSIFFYMVTPYLFTLHLGSHSLFERHGGLYVFGCNIDLAAFAHCLTVISLPSKRKFCFFMALCTVSGGLSACLCMVPKKNSCSWFERPFNPLLYRCWSYYP